MKCLGRTAQIIRVISIYLVSSQHQSHRFEDGNVTIVLGMPPRLWLLYTAVG